MNKTRITALILALLMLAPSVVSCSETPVSEEETNLTEAETTDVAAVETETEESPRLPSTLPEDLAFGGKTVTMLHFTTGHSYQVSITEMTGDVFNDAVYQSNQRVMEDLDIVFEHIDNEGLETTKVQTSYTAGDDVYDIIYGTQWNMAPLVPAHMFANVNPVTGSYIEFDAPWWYGDYIDEAEVDNEHTYLLAGDASPDTFRRSSMMILNTDRLTDIGGNVKDIYDSVLEGKWTYDAMHTLVEKVYVDKNGDGVRSREDAYGYACNTASDVEHFLIAAGVRGCGRDEQGVPYIAVKNETTVKFVESLTKFLWENEGSYYVEGIPILDMLSAGRAMLVCAKFSNLDELRDCEANYTVIPLPKLDENIESYSSLAHDDALIMCIPIINQDALDTTAVLEKMSYEYYYEVMPQYYDVVLKSKYRRDSSDAASQMLDLIHDCMTTDFGYIYNYAITAMITTFRDYIGGNKADAMVSVLESREKMYQKALTRLIDSIMEGQ